MGTSYSNIDASFSTTLATTVPSVEVQTAFSALVSALFTALTALIPYKKVTDEQLSAVLATVATADMTAYLVTFDGSLAIMNAQVTFITGQQKAMSDFQKSVKKSVETFTKDLSKMTKSTKDSKDSGMKNWNGALIKLQGDQKKSGEKIQKGLKANANVDQSAAASIASTKIDAFYVKFGSSSTDVNVLLSAQLSAQYDFSLTQQTLFTDYEVTMISAQVTSVASFLYVNVDGAGQKCLKVMTDQFAAMDKQYQTAQYMCFEDLTTYVSFSTEFINILLSIVKCQSDAVVNYLPACLKQISKKTSSTYNNAMYNTCLSAVSIFESFYKLVEILIVKFY